MKRLFLVLLLVSCVFALEFDGECFKITLPNRIQVKRGETASFELTLYNSKSSENLESVEIEVKGELDHSYFTIPDVSSVKWEEERTVTLNMPYNESEGYYNVIFAVSADYCDEDYGNMMVNVLRGDEFSLSVSPADTSATRGEQKVVTLEVENKGAEGMEVTIDQRGVANSALSFQPKTTQVGGASKKTFFVTVNTSMLDFGNHTLSFIAVSDVSGVNSTKSVLLEVTPATIPETRRQDRYDEISRLRKSLDAFRDKLNSRELLDAESTLDQAAALVDAQRIPEADALLEELREMEASNWGETPEAEAEPVRTPEISERDLVLLKWELKPYLPVVNISIGLGLVFLFIHMRLPSMVEVVKSVTEADGVRKVRVQIVNHSMVPLRKVTLLERLPEKARLNSTFKADGNEKRFKMRNTLYAVPIGTIGAGDEAKVEYEVAGKGSLPAADIEFSFLKKFRLRSNEPID